MLAAAVPGRSQAGLGSPTFPPGSLPSGAGIVSRARAVRTDWPPCRHMFDAPRCRERSWLHRVLCIAQGALQHMCEGVFKQPYAPGPGSEPAELSQLENRTFPSQAGSPRTLRASTWLLKHSYTGSSSLLAQLTQRCYCLLLQAWSPVTDFMHNLNIFYALILKKKIPSFLFGPIKYRDCFFFSPFFSFLREIKSFLVQRRKIPCTEGELLLSPVV